MTHVCEPLGASERRACRALQQARSTQRHAATVREIRCGPIVYLAHAQPPFSKLVLERILEKLQTSLATQPRDVWICYMHLYAHAPLDGADFLELVTTHPQYRIYRAQCAV